MRFTRRQTLMLLGWSASLPILTSSRSVLAAPDIAASRLAQLKALTHDSQLAPILGRAYRAAYPAEAVAATLSRLLCLDLGLADAPDSRSVPDRQELLAALDARVRAQFSAGQTVVVQGWVLARTEARLCALCD
jgi:hypothetical protein